MKSVFKFAGIGIGILILLGIAAIIIIPLVVDINDYKDRIVSLVEKQTGRQLKIQGDIELSVFPWLGVKLGVVELGNAKGFKAPMFARVQQLQVRVRILPLLSKTLEADVVTVRGLSLNLERNKDGRTNWQDLIKPRPEKTQKSTPAFGALAIGGVTISDASVSWTDRVTDQRFDIRDLSIKTSAIRLNHPVDVKIGFAVDTGELGLQGRFNTGARIHLDFRGNVFTLKDIQLTAELDGKMLPGGKATIRTDGALAFNADKQRLNLQGLRVEASGMSVASYTTTINVETQGSADLSAQVFDLTGLKAALTMSAGKERIHAAIAGNVRADFKEQKIILSALAFSMPEFKAGGTRIQLSSSRPASAILDIAAMTLSVDGVKIAGTVYSNAIPNGSIPVALGFDARADLRRQTISMDPATLEAFGMKTTCSLSLLKLPPAYEIKGTINFDRFNLKKVISRLLKNPPTTADPEALSSVKLSVVFSAASDRLKVNRLIASIDGSQLTGTFTVNNFISPDVHFDFAMDRLNLDRYLPPKQNGIKTAATVATAAGTTAAAVSLPIETLRKLLCDGKLRISAFTASGVKMKNFVIGVQARNGVIRTEPLGASLYGGSLAGFVELDVRAGRPKLTFDEKLSEVRLDHMLKDLGIAAGSVNVSGSSLMSLKGSVVTDKAFKVIQVKKLLIGGMLGNRLKFGLDAGGTLFNLNDQTLTAEGLKMNLAGMTVKATTKVTGLFTRPAYRAEIKTPVFNLRRVLTKLGQTLPKTSDPKAMSVVEVSASVNGNENEIGIESFKVRLDDTRFQGKATIQFKPSPMYRLEIRADTMDADRYLPPKKKRATSVAATPGAAAAALPVDTLRSMNLDGALVIEKLKITNLRLNNIQLKVKARDGLLTVNPLTASLYGGTYRGNISLDSRGNRPKLAMDEAIAGVQIGTLLKDLLGQTILTGITNATINLTAMGVDVDTITRTLNGKVEFQLTDGSIEKLNILGKLCRTFSAVSAGSFKKEDIAAGMLHMIARQMENSKKDSSDRTVFSELGGLVVFTDGIGVIKGLSLKSPLLR
ncbi:MAG: AsmA family protein, partial [Deltaproteobacteria bacterium]|nr:AsmA family protein [Deltaproteobacteria bacterium]